MKLILVIKSTDGFYRIYYDIKYDDWFILTPKFHCSRNIGHVGLNEYRFRIESAIENARLKYKE